MRLSCDIKVWGSKFDNLKKLIYVQHYNHNYEYDQPSTKDYVIKSSQEKDIICHTRP